MSCNWLFDTHQLRAKEQNAEVVLKDVDECLTVLPVTPSVEEPGRCQCHGSLSSSLARGYGQHYEMLSVTCLAMEKG